MARMALLLLLLTSLAAAEDVPARSQFAGDAACAACHKDQVDSYERTAHHLTSQLANGTSILGTFARGSNVLMIADPAKATVDPGLYFKMEKRPEGFYQTATAGWPALLQTRSERMDIVIGSGVRGQSYLYWHGQQLFELPVSYWSDGNQWINSPGYQNGTMNFARPVTPRCLECHATFAEALSPDPASNRYVRQSLILGVTCERCHGSGVAHIAQAKGSILNPAGFSRDRQVDLCALCHNGTRSEELTPAFMYVPGKPLDKYLQANTGEMAAHPDVHGNQVGLLKSSRCYLSSPSMSCSTCHNVHQPEKSAAAYSTRCLACHQVEQCGMAKSLGSRIADNCIDCHMPVQPTNAIISETAGQVIRPKMRNHWIKVYPAGEIP